MRGEGRGVRGGAAQQRCESRAWVLGWDSRVAGIAQLVEHNLAKVGVAGSSPVSRSPRWTVWQGGGLAKAINVAGWSSLVARRAHNPEVVGSNPTPAMVGQTGRRTDGQ